MLYNTIEHILKDIKLHIPNELLVETFLRDSNGNIISRSLDGVLKEVIIIDIVLRHANLFAGKILKIQLQESWAIQLEDSTLIPYTGDYRCYKIPPEAREFKDINYAIDVCYPYGYAFTNPYYGQTYNNLASETNKLFETTFSAGTVTPIPSVKESNMIYLDPPQPYHIDWLVTCITGFDSNFTNLKWNCTMILSEMAIYATKMYIYNKLKIAVDAAYISSGHELGAFKEILESYSDANEKYKEALMNFRGAVNFDEETTLGLLNLMIN